MVLEKVGKKRKARTLQSNGVGEATVSASGTSGGGGDRTKDTSPTPSNAGELSALTLKFIKGLASRLVENDGDSVEDAFRAAIAVLPKGKLRREIRGNMQVALVVLAGELNGFRAETKSAVPVAVTEIEPIASNEEMEENDKKVRDGKQLDAPVEQAPVPGVDEPQTPTFVASTPRLYNVQRAKATNAVNRETNPRAAGDALRALCFNPRAPVDLLLDAMGNGLLNAQEEKSSRSETRAKQVQVAVARLKLLTRVLAVDPIATSSAPDLAFVVHHAEAQAALISAHLREEGSVASKDGKCISSSAAIEGLGLLHRLLHAISLASEPGVDHSRRDAEHDNDESTSPPSYDSAASRADRLVLRCIPSTRYGNPRKGPVSAARSSIARLVGHYAVSVATICSLDRGEDGAREIIRRIGHISVGAKRGAVGQGESGGAEEDNSAGTDSDAESSDEDGDDHLALLHHLLILCVLHLKGDESSTLEFLRCVGDACVCGEEDSRPPVACGIATSLAPICARVLSRLSRPNETSVDSPIRFLGRAYAFRLVEYLSSQRGKLGRGKGRRPLFMNPSASSVGSCRPWDFVGDAPIPSSVKKLMGTTSPPPGVEDAAMVAYSALAEQRGDLRGIAEVLRSSPACDPHALGALLDALEKVAGSQAGSQAVEAEAGGEEKKGREEQKKRKKGKNKKLKGEGKGERRGKGGGEGEGDDAEETAGLAGSEGFFIDTKGGKKHARGAGGISLAPLADPRTPVDQSVPEDSSEREGD